MAIRNNSSDSRQGKSPSGPAIIRKWSARKLRMAALLAFLVPVLASAITAAPPSTQAGPDLGSQLTDGATMTRRPKAMWRAGLRTLPNGVRRLVPPVLAMINKLRVAGAGTGRRLPAAKRTLVLALLPGFLTAMAGCGGSSHVGYGTQGSSSHSPVVSAPATGSSAGGAAGPRFGTEVKVINGTRYKWGVRATPFTAVVQLPDGTSAPPGKHFLQVLVAYRNLQTDRTAPLPSDVSIEVEVRTSDLGGKCFENSGSYYGVPATWCDFATEANNGCRNNLTDDTNVPPGQTTSVQFTCSDAPDSIPTSDFSVWVPDTQSGNWVQISSG